MLRSMTGYGKISEIIETKKVTVEIKSLNSKNFNPFIKIPESYNEKEIEIKNIIYEFLQGGKVNFTLQIETETGTGTKINEQIFSNYLNQLKKISEENGLHPENEQLINAVLKLPEVLSSEQESINEDEWEKIVKLISSVLEKIDSFRIQEGKALEEDILQNIKNIELLIPDIEKFEEERITSIKQRLEKKLYENINTADEMSADRFEQEIIYFLDKLDINEEKIRLKNHCKYFRETVNSEEPTGTKLGFIAQEIGREINTMGSKANHSEIQKTVVMMKDNLGKIKEQLLNVL